MFLCSGPSEISVHGFHFYELVDLVGERTETDQGSVKVPVGEIMDSESIGVRWEPLFGFSFAQMLWSYCIPMRKYVCDFFTEFYL